VAEIVVVLNETTDDSALVARSFGAHVEHRPWRGYRDSKNDALNFAREPWVLSLDADEEVSAELRHAIEAFFAQGRNKHYCAARFPRKVWFIDRWITHGDWYPDYSLRLFQRGKARWGGDAIVHEKLECEGPVATLRADLHHYSFPSLSHHVLKISPFADLFVRQQQARGRGFSLTAALVRPWWRFFRGYVVKRGFLDGYPGFYIACANSFAAFVRQSRLYEAERQTSPRIDANPR
jgi:glycosyltransferase involved in cell wall biosynthesis